MRAWGWTTLPVGTTPAVLLTVLNRKLSLLTQWVEDASDSVQGVGALALNVTQPSVAGKHLWRAANTSATTITALREGRAGQTITVWFDNGNTTLQHGTNLQLVGSVNYTGASGKAIQLGTVDGTVWRELPLR